MSNVFSNHKCNFLSLSDANGIIMGEFGFITADDVYHVTVYATDENGNFKILSMKNIKLMKGPAPQALALPITTSTTTSTTPQPFTVKTTPKTAIASPPSSVDAACASCRLPAKSDTETIKPSPPPDTSADIPPPFKVVSKDDKLSTETPTPQAETLPLKIVNQVSRSGAGINTVSENGPNGANGINQALKNNIALRDPTNTNGIQDPLKSLSLPKDRQPAVNEKLQSPQMFNKNGGNTAHYNKMENLMNGLLYRFNYTTDFQGHREEGDRSGNKDGEYYSVGRDNIKRVVSYKANEFGYMPFIRQEPLNPQELQNYDESNNRLRGYKFEWFYP